MRKFISLIFIGLFSITVNVEAQDLVQESIGEKNVKEQKVNSADSLFLPLEKWSGKKIIFLPKPKGFQDIGYFYPFAKTKSRVLFEETKYEDLVGETALNITITGHKSDKLIEMKTDKGTKYYGRIGLDNTVDGLAFLNDLLAARKAFLGDTLWYIGKKRALSTYNASNDQHGKIIVSSTEPLLVNNIVASWWHNVPVRFILEKKDGSQGFIDVNISGNNTFENKKNKNRFEDFFLKENPRSQFDWPEKTWLSISKSDPVIGMTKDQLILSIGAPEVINQTSVKQGTQEQWIYENYVFEGYVYLENGKVSGIQN